MSPTVKPSFEKIIDSLMNEVVIGKAHLAIGEGLQGIDPAVRLTAQVFFDLTLTAHLEASQMYAAKLFDKQKDAVTVENMLKAARMQLGAFRGGAVSDVQGAIDSAKKRIAGLSSTFKALQSRRNNFLAHLSPQTVHDSKTLAKNAHLTIADLEKVFAEAGIIVNEFMALWKETTSITDLTDVTDYTNALKLIADAKCAQIRELEAKYNQKWSAPRPKGCK